MTELLAFYLFSAAKLTDTACIHFQNIGGLIGGYPFHLVTILQLN